MKEDTKCVSLYLSTDEYTAYKQEADYFEITISAYIRQLLKLPEKKRGAPIGNENRTGKKLKKIPTK